MNLPQEPAPATVRVADRLPATVRALGWTSFLTDFSSEAIYPLLPGFVKGLGGTSVEIGLIDGIANAVAAVVRLPSGAVSDAVPWIMPGPPSGHWQRWPSYSSFPERSGGCSCSRSCPAWPRWP